MADKKVETEKTYCFSAYVQTLPKETCDVGVQYEIENEVKEIDVGDECSNLSDKSFVFLRARANPKMHENTRRVFDKTIDRLVGKKFEPNPRDFEIIR